MTAGPGAILAGVVVAVVCALLAVGLSRARLRLRRRGALPALALGGEVIAWTGAAVVAADLVVRITPSAWRPWLPAVAGVTLLVGVALARGVLRELLAGAAVVSEGRVREGALLTVGAVRGHVERVGARAVVLRDRDGREHVLSHLKLRARDVVIEPDGHPEVVVTLRVPDGVDAGLVRERLREAALVSPWRVPAAVPVVRRGEAEGSWEVAVRVLDVAYERQHVEAVRGMAREGIGLEG